MSQTARILALGLVFHLVYIMSVFDCYFTSPVVHGMQHFSAAKAEAKRLVLFVGDGLRADLLYNLNAFPGVPDSPEVVAPYLRDVWTKRGAFGVSHTRVPTESRPGHVAIIAGMYEDVSAVTKGWKTNPVDFDSVFNQSSATFSFGSPDILPMFARGAVPGKVMTIMYDEEDEDFTKDATELDTWVFEQLRNLLQKAKQDIELWMKLRGDKVVFFFHLLGLDTTGHSYRPHSKEYMRNIQVVDSIVNQTERLLREFFNDDKTAYIFTADHGMSNIGNHGDGNPDSTRTPLIAWGAGVRGPLPDSTPSSHDEYSELWGADVRQLLRRDVEQVDIAPLMAALLGLNFPVNSVGVLADVDVGREGYLSLREGEEQRAKLAVVNAKSILEQYRVKHRLKAARKIFFVPFPGLVAGEDVGVPGSSHLLKIESLLSARKWRDARSEASKLITLSLEGIRYLETYDRTMLYIIVTIGYLGWSAFSATALFFKPPSKLASSGTNKLIIGLASGILISTYALFVVQREPWTYYLYVAFPCYFWSKALQRVAATKSSTSGSRSWVGLTFTGLIAFLVLQCMVYAYKARALWSLGLVVGGLLWPIVSWPESVIKHRQNRALWLRWATACLICAIFPLRNVEQSEDLSTITIGGCAMIAFGLWSATDLNKSGDGAGWYPMRAQLGLAGASILVTFSSVRHLIAKTGLPLFNQVLGWIILASSVLFPVVLPFRSLSPASKLLTLFLTFTPCFVILSICAEGLFYLSYCALLIIWIEVEREVRRARTENEAKRGMTQTDLKEDRRLANTQYVPRGEDVRMAVFFLFFVQLAFFGTGNVASISSFYLEPVYRLVPIFSPFIMAALLIFKIIAPYVVLSAVFAHLTAELSLPPFSLFMIALSLTDVMTITFFMSVTDTGSWLEIGQSISHFVITSLLLVWSAGICALGEWLMQADPSLAKVLNDGHEIDSIRADNKEE